MKHLKALAIKLLSLFVVLWLVLGVFYGNPTGDIFTITLVLGIISYIVGDLVILRNTSNTVATAADFGLSLLIVWFMVDTMTAENDPFTAALMASIGVAIVEYFFHKYVDRNVYEDHRQNKADSTGGLRYQTESSEELTDTKRKDE